MVEDVAGRASEKFEKVTLSFEVEREQAVSDFGRVDEGAKIGGEPCSVARLGGVASAMARKTSVRPSRRAS